MKMILAVLRDEYSSQVSQSLVEQNFRVTRLASTGGFFRRGSTTLMIGVEQGRMDEAIKVIDTHCGPPAEAGAKRATLFVLNVADFHQV